MNFTHVCVFIVIFLFISVATMLLNMLDDMEYSGIGWMISCLGFAVCLTILLFQNGII